MFWKNLERYKLVNKRLNFSLLIIAIVLLDQTTKLIATSFLPYSQTIEILPNFNFFLIFNAGAAFSILDDGFFWQQLLLLGVPFAALFFFFHLIYLSDQLNYFKISICFITGGAIGNLIDRVFSGYVVDFIDLYVAIYHWPTFNIADAFITLGASVLVIVELRSYFREIMKEKK